MFIFSPFLKIKIKFFMRYILILIIISAITFPFTKIEAASMTARDYLNRNVENLTSGVTHEIVFTPATNVSGGAGTNKIILIFPDGDDGKWCVTAGTDLAVATTNLHDSATALPGTTKTAKCVQGSGSSNYDTLTIEGVDNLTASTAYGVRISDGSTGKLGTPANTTTGVITVKTNNGSADVDTRNIVADIVANDQITITGSVDPTLSFSVSDTQIGFGTITSATVRYATADETGSASEPAADSPTKIVVSTNAQSGLVVEIKDTNSASGSGLYNASPATTLTSRASTAVAAGTIGFGVYGKNASSVTLGEAFDNDSNSDAAISTSFQTIASTTGSVSSGSFDIATVAAIAGDTPPGDYTDTLTVVATGKF